MTSSGVSLRIVARQSSVSLSEVLINSVASGATVSGSGVPMISVAAGSFRPVPYLSNDCISLSSFHSDSSFPIPYSDQPSSAGIRRAR